MKYKELVIKHLRAIGAEYQRIKEEEPNKADSVIMTDLGNKYGWTRQGLTRRLRELGYMPPQTRINRKQIPQEILES